MFKDSGKIMEVVNFVWENRERIVDLIDNLPELLANTGENIESAGQSAIKTSHFLRGSKETEVNASDLSKTAATALNRAYREMKDVAHLMEKVSKELGEIRIPAVEPKYREIMGYNVVTGLDLSTSHPLADVATRLHGGSEKLGNLGQELREVSSSMRKLSGVMVDMGGDLHDVGLRLSDSGQTLRKITSFSSFGEVVIGKDDEEEDLGGFSVSGV